MIRIAEKLFKELKDCREEFLTLVQNNISNESNINLKNLTSIYLSNWREYITSLLQKRIQARQETVNHIYDFVRAKAMFKNVADIEYAAKRLLAQCKETGYRVIEVDNRINKNTKDIVFKIQIHDIVGQVQLALEFDSALNEFNHGLYEIKRSPVGSVFGIILWLGKLQGVSFLKDLKRLQIELQHQP